MKAVLIAGGAGSRIRPVAGDTPKPLLHVGGVSIVEHQIRLCRRYDIREIHLTVRAGDVRAFAQRLGSGDRYGVALHYHAEERPMGTAGGVGALLEQLHDRLLVLYADIMINMDLHALVEFHRARSAEATLVVHPTDHPLDSDLMLVDEDARVRAFLPKPRTEGNYYRNIGNAGAYVLSPTMMYCMKPEKKAPAVAPRRIDFIRDVFPRALREGARLFGYLTREYLKDTGTPSRLEAVRRDWESGRVRDRHRDAALPAIFFDRDGTLCEHVPFLSRVEDMRLIDGAAQAVRRANQANVLAVVATNQPVIARGECTPDELDRIHARMEMLLGREGGVLDAIYYCPHHPEAGHSGERPELKIRCACRKPATELLERAARDLNIDLARSAIVGDSTRDIETGKRLGLFTVLVETGNAGADQKYAAQPDARCGNVAEAVELVLDRVMPRTMESGVRSQESGVRSQKFVVPPSGGRERPA
jgi:histidinol-phosphate phosphatase family protein